MSKPAAQTQSKTASQNGRRNSVFSLRLNAEQRRSLERRAGSKRLGPYIRAELFGGTGGASSQTSQKSLAVRDPQALAQILAKLGHGDVAANLKVLKRAAESGSLAMTADAQAKLEQACHDIAEIRTLLMQALGIGLRK